MKPLDIQRRIVYEDNHILIVSKPPNMPVQADASGDMDLLTLLKLFIKEKYEKPGEVYLGLVHRLDRPVGGAMVFARTTKAAQRLSEQVRTRQMGRIYWAVVSGNTPDEGRMEHQLRKEESTNTTRVVPMGTPGAKEAKLSFRTLVRREEMSLVQIELETGRSHQIRVQFSHSGYPLYGDARYGDGKPGVQIALWARCLQLIHPTKKEPMQWVCPVPQVYPFTLFEDQEAF